MSTDEINLRDPRVQEVLDRFNETHPGVTLRVVDTPDDPRDELHTRIAGKLHAADCGCTSGVHEHDQWDYYHRLATSVMELFADVRPSPWLRAGWVVADIREESTDG